MTDEVPKQVIRYYCENTGELLGEFTREDLLTDDEVDNHERFEELVHQQYESTQAFVDKVPQMKEHLKRTPTDSVLTERARQLIENGEDEWTGGA